jgi:phage-related protein
VSGRSFVIRMIGDASSIVAAAKQAGTAISGLDKGSGLSTLSSKFEQVGRGMMKLGRQMTTLVTVPIVAGMYSAVKAASNFAEQTNRINKLFGAGAPAVKAWADGAADALGVNKTKALEAAATYATLGQKAGLTGKALADFSIGLVKTAIDLGSFVNLPVPQALNAISSGLAGQSRPLKNFQILLTQSAVDARAFSMGLVQAKVDTAQLAVAQDQVARAAGVATKAIKDHGAGSREATEATHEYELANARVAKLVDGKIPKLTEEQKIMARVAEITSQAAFANNDFADTSNGVANQSKIVAANFENLRIEVGTKLIPAFLEILHYVREAISWFRGLSDGTQKFLLIGLALIAVLGPLLIFFGAIVLAINAIGLPIILVVAAFAALVAAVIYAYTHFEWFRNFLDNIGEFIVGTILPIVRRVGEWFADAARSAGEAWQKYGPTMIQILRVIVDYILNDVIPAMGRVLETMTGWASNVLAVINRFVTAARAFWEEFGDDITRVVKAAWDFAYSIVAAGLRLISNIIKVVTKLIHGDWSGAWQAMKTLVSDWVSGIGSILSRLGSFLSAAFRLAWTLASAAFKAGVDAVTSVVRVFLAAIPGILNALGGLISRAFDAAWNLGKAAFQVGINAIVQLAQTIKSRVVSGLGNLGSALFQAGVDLITGLANGIKAKAEAAVAAIRSVGASVVAAGKKVFDINSPSLVFHEIGLGVGEGLANGVAAGAFGAATAATTMGKKVVKTAQDALFAPVFKALGLTVTDAIADGVDEGGKKLSKKMQEMADKVKKKAEEAAQHVRDSVSALTGLASAGDGLVNANGSKADAADAVIAAQEALNEVKARAATIDQRLTTARQKLAEAQRVAAEITAEEQVAIERATDALDKAKVAYDEGKISAAELQVARDNLTKAQKDAIDPTKETQDELRDLNTLQEEAAKLASDLEKAQKDLAKANKALADAERAVATAKLAVYEAGKKLAEMGPKARAEWEAQARAAGLTTAEINGYIQSILAIPAAKGTVVTTTFVTVGDPHGGMSPAGDGHGDGKAGTGGTPIAPTTGGRVKGGSYAAGGYFTARPGGYIGRLAEGRENEVVAPEPILRRIVNEESGSGGGGNIVIEIHVGTLVHEKDIAQMVMAGLTRANLVTSDGRLRTR